MTWACERLDSYLVGTTFHIETDHKPLVPLLTSKRLDELPLRVQRFRMRLMRFRYTVSHVPGKDVTTADALSLAPQAEATQKDNILCREVNTYVCMVVENLSATEERIREIQTCQEEDGECRQIRQYCREGWPAKTVLKGGIKKYTAVAHKLTVNKGVLLRGSRLVIPASLQADVLD